jgi:hypothetical protein
VERGVADLRGQLAPGALAEAREVGAEVEQQPQLVVAGLDRSSSGSITFV